MEAPAAVARLAGMLQEKESRAAEVARLLHDDVGPTLSAVGFHLQAMGGDREVATQIQGYLEQIIDTLRAASRKLHFSAVERSGLPMAIELLVNHFREEHGLDIHLDMKVDHRHPPAIASAVYRVVELALDNVVRHAGVRRAELRLVSSAATLRAEVLDNGVGFDPEHVRIHPPGAGLVLMHTFAGIDSLHLRIDSAPGKGTIIGIQTN